MASGSLVARSGPPLQARPSLGHEGHLSPGEPNLPGPRKEACLEPVSDLEIGERRSNPKPEEFEAIFHRYGKPVLSFICSLTGDHSNAEELTQETFIRAFCGFHTRQENTKISTWLFGIAHNVVREAIRQKCRKPHSVGLDEPASQNLQDLRQRPDQHAISRDMFRKIRKALASLTEDHRIVFVLKMVYRLQYEEISSITGASVGKLKTDLHRARHEMRRRLVPFYGNHVPGSRGES